MNKEYKGIGALTISALFYGLFPVFNRFAGDALPFFYQNSVRLLVAFVIFLGSLIALHNWKTVQKKDYKWFLLRSFAVFFAFTCFTYSLKYIPIGTTLFTFYAGSTVVGYLIGSIFFGEKLTRIKLISLFLALLGLLFIYSVDINLKEIPYAGLAFLAGCFTAVWNIFSKKVSDKYSSSQLNMIDNGLAYLLAAGVSLTMGEKWLLPAVTMEWGVNILFGLGIALSSVFIVYGFMRMQAQIGSLIMLSEVLFAILFAYVFFQEVPSQWSFVGGTMILVAIILPELNWKQLSKRFSS